MLPVCLQVCCGDMVGVLLVAKGKIALNFGQHNEKEVSPTEFERLGGRSATKKWKQSIRLIDDNGELELMARQGWCCCWYRMLVHFVVAQHAVLACAVW